MGNFCSRYCGGGGGGVGEGGDGIGNIVTDANPGGGHHVGGHHGHDGGGGHHGGGHHGGHHGGDGGGGGGGFWDMVGGILCIVYCAVKCIIRFHSKKMLSYAMSFIHIV